MAENGATDDPAAPAEAEPDVRESGMQANRGADTRARARTVRASGVLPRLTSRFYVQRELGRGGSGTVYQAYDRSAGHEVALKILHGLTADDRRCIKSEFRALSDIVHPNLVDLYDLVVDEEACFFTMELVTGSDFATYVAGLRQTLDGSGAHERLLDLARQLALGLNAVHRTGKLHRDIKPTNVLVTDAGRVVLVDFGLAMSTAGALHVDGEATAGTPLYMSPEQLVGDRLGPPSDWYAFGVTLYEAVSGDPPKRLDLFRNKAQSSSKSLRALGFDVPEDFDALVAALLEPDPQARPDAAGILQRLGSRVPIDGPGLSLAPQHGAPELVGREAELACLRRALDAEGGTRVVRVLGPSGIGKTSVIRGFLEALRESPEHLVLESKCHPQETVVFNAIDGLIDGLASRIADCLEPEERTLPGAEHAALSQVFPVLGTVLDGGEPEGRGLADDRGKRHLAFVGLCEVLMRVSRRHRIVAWLDDVQWADRDSGMLLRDLLGRGDCPPMLLVLSYRSEDARASPCLQVLQEESDAWTTAATMALMPLGHDESRELVDGLLGDGWGGDQARKDELVRAAAGSPYVLGELARYLASSGSASAGGPSSPGLGLEEILRVRTSDLPIDCRSVLDVLAVAGAPLEQQVTLAAAGVASGSRGLITSLERLSIVRTTDIRTRRIEFYHDRMREEVMSRIGDDHRRVHHHAIARALLATEAPNPLAAIDHFEAAGDAESVRRYVVAAANHAFKNLAFERAARLYRRAIELVPGEVPLHELQRRLGSALGSAGRGREAALAYSIAVDLLRTDGQAHPEQVLQLQQRAAEQYIESGHFGEGVRILRSVLTDFSVPFPRSRQQALGKAALLRIAALAHGYRRSEIKRIPSEHELLRFDALWAATSRLALVDYALSSWASARCARDSVLLGEPSRMSRALSMEASHCSILPGPIFPRRARALLAKAEALAREGADPEYDAIFTLGERSIVSFYTGCFRDTWRQADEAMVRLRKHSPGRKWEDGAWEVWALVGLALNGEIRELVRRMLSVREDAALRDDRFMMQHTSLGIVSIAWLAADRAEEAEAWANRAFAWAPPEYSAQHYMHYVSSVEYALYRGDGLSAWQRTVESWPSHAREGFLLLTFIRDELFRARGRAALAAELALRKSGRRATATGETPRDLHAIAKDAARRMKRRGTASARGCGSLLEACIAEVEGRTAAALTALDAAITAFEEGEMQLFREVARSCLGTLRRDSRGRAEFERAEQWMTAQGIVKPRKVVATLAPGITGPDAGG